MLGTRSERRTRRSLLARARALKGRAYSVRRLAMRTSSECARAALLEAAQELTFEAQNLERSADAVTAGQSSIYIDDMNASASVGPTTAALGVEPRLSNVTPPCD